MDEAGQDYTSALRGIEPTVSFVDGRTFLSIRNQVVGPGILVEQADLELVDTSTPVDDLVHQGSLQHQATRLLRLSFSIDINQVSDYCAHALLQEENILETLRFYIEGSQLVLETSVDGTVALAKLFSIPAENGKLRLIIDEELWFGFACLRSLPRELFDLLSKVIEPANTPGLNSEMTSPCEISLDLVQAICWSLFPAFGWKLPLYRDLSIVQSKLDSTAKIRVHALSDLAPRRFHIREGSPEREEAIVLKTLARQDAIKLVPASIYMLNEPDYLLAAQQLYESLPKRASSALIERMLVVGLPEPSLHEECESILARELAIRPNSVPALLIRAQICFSKNDVRRAAEDYLEIANRTQRSRAAGHAYRHAALALAEVDPERSLNYLEYAISLAPDHLGIQLDFAQAQAEQGQHAEAVNMLDAIASDSALRPGLRASVFVQAGEWLAYELNDRDAAQRCFDQALELDPEHPDALLGIAQILHHRGDLQRAALILERLLDDALENADKPRASTLCMFLGDMWAPTDPEAAIQRYEMACSLDPENEGARLRLSDVDEPISVEASHVLDEIMIAAAAASPSVYSKVKPEELSESIEIASPLEITESQLNHPAEDEKPTAVEELEPSLNRPAFRESAEDRFETLTRIVTSAIMNGQPREDILEVLNEIIISGSTQDRDKAYALIRAQCEAEDQKELYSFLLAHRIKNTPDLQQVDRLRLEQGEFYEFKLNELSKAENAYRAALKANPDNDTASKGLGRLLMAQDRYGEVLDELGQETLSRDLVDLLSQGVSSSSRAMEAGRVLASAVPSIERGQFFFDLASKLSAVEHQCEAIFEASHFDDVNRSELMDFLAELDVRNSNEDRALVLKTCLSLEENQERRVELRMALGECMASKEVNISPLQTTPASSSEEEGIFDGISSTVAESIDLPAGNIVSNFLSVDQIDHLESRAQRMLEKGKTAWAVGPMKIVQAVRGPGVFGPTRMPDLSKLVTNEALLHQISAQELHSPLGRLLFASSKALGQLLPTQPDEARIEMDERGSEEGLRKILTELRETLGLEFRVLVDLDTANKIETLVSKPPAICLPANILKEASETELRFRIGRWLTYIRIGGLLYRSQSIQNRLSDWIELLYWALDEDALDRIPYEYASYVEPLRENLTEAEQEEILSVRRDHRYEEVLSEAASWPRIADRVCARSGFLLSKKLSVSIQCLEDQEPKLTEDLLDFLLSEYFARLIEPFYKS